MNKFLFFNISLFVFLLSCENKNTNSNKLKTEVMEKSQIDIETEDITSYPIVNKSDTISSLKIYFDHFSKYKDSISELEFFNYFPNTFEKFNNLYGFSEDKGEMPLYNYYHIEEYDKLRKIVSDQDYYYKLISLGINGKWEADNISSLQDVIIKNFFNNPSIFLIELKQFKNTDQVLFWNFYFDTPEPSHPQNKNNQQKTLSLLTSNNYNLIDSIKNIIEHKNMEDH